MVARGELSIWDVVYRALSKLDTSMVTVCLDSSWIWPKRVAPKSLLRVDLQQLKSHRVTYHTFICNTIYIYIHIYIYIYSYIYIYICYPLPPLNICSHPTHDPLSLLGTSSMLSNLRKSYHPIALHICSFAIFHLFESAPVLSVTFPRACQTTISFD